MNSDEKSVMGRNLYFLRRFYIILALMGMLIGCKDTGGKVEGKVDRGILDTISNEVSSTWNFLTASDYIYDSNYVQVSGNKVSLKTVNTTFDSAATFDSGTHVGTVYSGGVLKLQPSITTLGTLTSLPNSSQVYGYWQMEGDWADASGNGRTLVASGNTTWSTNAKAGVRSAIFDGASDYLQLPSTINLGTGQAFTVSVWVYISADDSNPRRIFNWGLTDGNGRQEILCFVKVYTADHRINCELWKNGVNANSGSTMSLSVNNWYHLVVSSDGTTLKTYLNGVKFWTRSHDILSTAAPFRIGSDFSGNVVSSFNGNLDDLIIWTGSLTDADIYSLYSRLAPFPNELSSSWAPQWTNLVGYWKMDGNWLDSSGNSRNGTVVGNPTTSGAGKVGVASGNFAGGAGNYVYFTNTSGLNIQDTTFSFSIWFRTTTTDGVLVSKGAGNGQTGGFSAGVNSTGYIGIAFKDTAGNNAYIFSGSSKVNDGVWHHLAARLTTSTTSGSANAATIFLDGKPASGVTTGSVGTPFGINTTDSLAVGARGVPLYGGPANYFTGLLDDMAFWSVGLNDADFLLIYNRQKQKYAGSYDSSVIDMGAAAPWPSLSSVNALPFYKELPDSSEASSSYASVAGSLMANAVAHWKFNDGLSESLSSIAVTTTAGTLDYQSAKFASGLRVSDGEVNYTSDARINQSTTFSFQTWLKSSGAANINYAHLVGKRDLGVAGWTLTNSLASSGKIQLRIDTSAAAAQAAVSNSTTVMDGNWHHIVIVLDGGNGSLYIDGVLDKSFTYLPGTGLSNSAPFRFGYETHDTVAEYDEAVYWTRVISSSEVLQLYRRGANRVKYQVRSCIDSSCACRAYSASPAGSALDCDGDGIVNASDTSDSYAASWIGPDGTASTYFSEIQNNTAVDSLGSPTGLVNVMGLTLDWSGSFFPAAARPTLNRYFQYRVYMESDDQNNLCSGTPCMPEVTSIVAGSRDRYYGGSPTIMNNTAINFAQLQTMNKSDINACTTFQLSTDNGSSWKWWNGAAWAITTSGVSTSNHLSDFTTSRLQLLGSGSYKFKAFLNTNTSSDFTQSCDLTSVGITYTP